jgi:hypothetical protein
MLDVSGVGHSRLPWPVVIGVSLNRLEVLPEVLKTWILSGKTPCRLAVTDVSGELVCSLLLEYLDPDGVCRKILQARL